MNAQPNVTALPLDRKAAVIAYATGYGEISAAIRLCYADGDWSEFQAGLDSLAHNFEANKPRVASMKSIMRRIAKGLEVPAMTIGMKKGAFTVQAQVTEQSKSLALNLNNLKKHFETLRTMREQLRTMQAQGLPGADDVLAELELAWTSDTELPDFEFEARHEVVAIIRSEEA